MTTLIAGISVVHPGIGQRQHLLVRFIDGTCQRHNVEDAYALRLGCTLIEGAVANINSRPGGSPETVTEK